MWIKTLGNVTVKNIKAYGNGGKGVYISNHGDSGEGFGGVKVLADTNQSNDFSGNGETGLEIDTNGSVYLLNSWGSGNSGDGISVNNAYGGTAPVTYVTTGKVFYMTGNDGDGLEIKSKGNVTLSNQYGLRPTDNAYHGVYINNQGSSLPAYVRLTNVYAYNNDNGINVESSGYIYASSLTAEYNNNIGAHLESGSGAIAGMGL